MVPGGAGCCPDRGKPVGQRRIHDAGVRPPHGRRRVERGERLRAGEGRGKPGRTAWLGRKGGGWPSSAWPLFFFLNFFSPKSLNKIFEAFANLFRGWSKNKKGSPQNPLQLCFSMQIQILNRI